MTTGRIPSIEGGIQPTIFDAKADLLTATAADTPARLAVGANDTVLTADSSTATGLKWAAPAAEKVKQIVSSTITAQTAIASGSYSDSGITATITPTSASNKIYIIISASTEVFRSADSQNTQCQLLRGATQIQEWNSYKLLTIGGATSVRSTQLLAITYLDSPATTSATTYKIQAKCESTSSGRISFQRDSTSPSTITLIEVE